MRTALTALRPYTSVAGILAVLTVVLALGWTGWAPTTQADWLMLVVLVPAGVGGVLFGDRVGVWLKEQGYGRS